jgi:hypothetical protein
VGSGAERPGFEQLKIHPLIFLLLWPDGKPGISCDEKFISVFYFTSFAAYKLLALW